MKVASGGKCKNCREFYTSVRKRRDTVREPSPTPDTGGRGAKDEVTARWFVGWFVGSFVRALIRWFVVLGVFHPPRQLDQPLNHRPTIHFAAHRRPRDQFRRSCLGEEAQG